MAQPPTMNSVALARQLLQRDWRSGDVRTLFFSLVIAVAAVLTIALMSNRLLQGISTASTELIGGDLVIESTRQPKPQWQQQAKELGLQHTLSYSFDSIVFFNDELLLCSVKAVDDNYPLIGQLSIQPPPENSSATAKQTSNIPAPGTAWVDGRVLDRLGAQLGDEVYFGDMTLTITHIVNGEPDQGNSLFQFAPRFLINAKDLEPAKILGPGSRVKYHSMIYGENSPQFKALLFEKPAFAKPLLTKQLSENPTANNRLLNDNIPEQKAPLGMGHRLIEPGNSNNRASKALSKASQYIRIATLMALILSAIAIALSARRYSERQVDVSALLRSFGASGRAILRLYVYQLLLLSLAAFVLAAVIGWAGHLAILSLLAPLLPVVLPAAGISPWLMGVGSGLLLMAGFALPPLLALSAVSPLRVLRRDFAPPSLSMALVYGAASLSQALLLWLLFDDLADILKALAATALVLIAIGLIIFYSLRWLRKRPLSSHFSSHLLARSLRNLSHHGAATTSQIMAFSLSLLLIIVVSQLRGGLVTEWQVQLPSNAPNHFVFNLFPEQVTKFKTLFENNNSLAPLYPVVRGRITDVNGNAEHITGGGDNHRELNFSATLTLPKDNNIIAGQWPPASGEVSVEAKYAKRLNLALGDTLRFNSGGNPFSATVSSLRTVQWESFTPNFYLLFNPEQLNRYPITYLSSFYSAGDNKALLKTLAQQFPALSIIDVGTLINRMQVIFNQISLSVELVMIFVLLSGFAVLFATLQSTSAQRSKESALMRAMGASRWHLQKVYGVEFGIIGAISGLIAAIGAWLISYFIYTKVFSLTFAPTLWLWIPIPFVSAIVVALAGYCGARKILTTAPTTLLSSTGD